MSELRPPMLNDHGLLPALRWYANEFSQRTGIDAAVSGKEPKQRPAQEIKITLFRIAQEALNNVAKHARATRIEPISSTRAANASYPYRIMASALILP